MSSPQQNAPTFLFDAFFSEDESFGEVIDPTHFTSKIFTDFLENGFLWDSDDDQHLGILLKKEKSENDEILYNGLEKNPFLTQCRNDAVEWILKVVGHYSFSALTGFLAVNFLDRFLCKFESHGEKPWMAHLAAVACLSLAAKVEETQVPLLLDLQVEECKYVFKSKTIQRMELLVLSTLEWKINPVTPISFLDFITKRLSLKTHISEEFIMRYECLVLSTATDCRYMCHLPSTLATATMLSVINNLEPCIGVDYHHQLIGIIGTKNKDKVEDCLRLIQEVESSNKRKFNGTLFCSPKEVMGLGISFSSENSYESWASVSSSVVNSSPEHLSKRIKSNHGIS